MPSSQSVRIVATPGGEAPLAIREAWVGLTLPLAYPSPHRVETIGILSLTRQPPRVGYLVDGRQAVNILAEKAPQAATWWLEQASHVVDEGYCLVFSAEVCEVEETV
jgi:hypothetical protein